MSVKIIFQNDPPQVLGHFLFLYYSKLAHFLLTSGTIQQLLEINLGFFNQIQVLEREFSSFFRTYKLGILRFPVF